MKKVSVIIPCYNQGRFLQHSIGSVLEQDYPNAEVIVVNDGSTDDTETIALSFPSVVYIKQPNSGVAHARNCGIDHASGDYLIFLDADDFLLAGALSCQAQRLDEHPEAAFVSGGHLMIDEKGNTKKEVVSKLDDDLYTCMLRGNYIGMHASVMYRKTLFQDFRFDTNMDAGEDYDLFLRIMARHPVYNHTKPIAAYRLHDNNASANLALMMNGVLQALEKQRKALKLPEQIRAFHEGRFNWIYYYGQQMVDQLIGNPELRKEYRPLFIRAFWKYRPIFYFKYLLHKYVH